MKILAFLQNQWFRDPAQAQAIYDRHPDQHEQLNARYLFAGCLTGRRLQAAFGRGLCDQIIWENASPKIAGESAGVFPADPQHMAAAIARHQPDLILLFGRIARDGYVASLPFRSSLFFDPICGPHPAARGGTVMNELRSMAGQIRLHSAAAPATRHAIPAQSPDPDAAEGSST